MSVLEDFLSLDEKGEKVFVGIVGDAMLDEYFDVKVKKISPEFPIPVMHSDTGLSENFPGGAANVAYQFKHFNCAANLIAFVDREAQETLFHRGIDVSMCLPIRNKIPRKRRFYSEDFPTYRWDIEKYNYGLNDIGTACMQLYEKVKDYTSRFSVMIFSDYDKGVFSNHLFNLVASSKISIVDPKAGGLDRWVGCTIFKPNKKEALALTGCETVNEAGQYLLDYLMCKAVIITQAGEGVTVFDDQGVYEIKPAHQLPPAESVIGAGDCFVSFLAMAMARNMTPRQAAKVAWQAGVLYVKNKHNKPVSPKDIMGFIDPCFGKIIPDYNFLCCNRDYKLVFTNGCFDILHAGHLHVLREASKLGDKLVVAVNTDESVSSLKTGRPFVPLLERMSLLAAIEYVDYVIPFSEQTPIELIQDIMPDVLVKGGEYKKEDIVGYGIVPEIVTIPMKQGLSTTNIMERIKIEI